jgi:hypothetical protein
MPFAKIEATLLIISIGNDMDEEINKKKEKYPRTPTKFIRFSGMALQMLATILIFTYAGTKIDTYLNNTTPVWTLILSLSSIFTSLYALIRNVTKL